MSITSDTEQLVENILDVLDGRLTRLVLAGDTVSGAEGVHGLRLVANCLWQAFEQDGTVLPVDQALPPPNGLLARKLVKTRKRLARVLRQAEVPVVVCYHLDDTGKWDLALSPGLTLDDAWEILTDFLKNHMDLGFIA